MRRDKGITQYFGAHLAELLADKILEGYRNFPKRDDVNAIKRKCQNAGYTQRFEIHADELATPEMS